MLLLLQRMVVAKIEEIDSRDRIKVVRLPCNHITDTEKCTEKKSVMRREPGPSRLPLPAALRHAATHACGARRRARRCLRGAFPLRCTRAPLR